MQNNIAILCTTLYLISQGTRIFVLVKPKHGILKNPGQTTLKTWKIKSGSTFAHLNLALNVGVFRFFPCNVKNRIGYIIKIFFLVKAVALVPYWTRPPYVRFQSARSPASRNARTKNLTFLERGNTEEDFGVKKLKIKQEMAEYQTF